MNIKDFIKGWVVGDFEPSILKTKDIEIGLKYYKKGQIDEDHYHKIITEYTIIVFGKVKMLNNFYSDGDIIKIIPLQTNKFECIEDACVLVIKNPSITNDKYII